jgi:hypothetical protein
VETNCIKLARHKLNCDRRPRSLCFCWECRHTLEPGKNQHKKFLETSICWPNRSYRRGWIFQDFDAGLQLRQTAFNEAAQMQFGLNAIASASNGDGISRHPTPSAS